MIDNLWVPPVGMGYLSPATTTYLIEMLDNYNMGIIGPGHCDDMSSDQ